MKKALILLTFSFIVACGSLRAQQCSDRNFFRAPTGGAIDVQEHIPVDLGSHGYTTKHSLSCLYSSTVPASPYCVTNSSSDVHVTETHEHGVLTNLVMFPHFIGSSEKGASQLGVNGAAAVSGDLGAFAVENCLFSCTVVIQIGGSANGVDFKAAFPPTTLWTHQDPQGISCGPVLDPTFVAPPPPCTPIPRAGGRILDGDTDPLTCTTPIIIDTEGEGFHLTSADNGVTFDIYGDGHPIRIAWTAPGYHNAFLALDRDGSGTITSGKELFGNVTAQAQSATPNGFLALAEFDKPENGGNGDGVIDEQDAVFSKLALWIDDNHDGVSQPSELHKLSEFGIHSLSISYFESQKTDEFGNQFRYKARVNPRKEDRYSRDETVAGEVGRWAYDVFFVTK